MQMFFELPLTTTFIAFTILLLVAMEAGYLVAKFLGASDPDTSSGVQSSFFGLLALLLAFTFSMANDRNEVRKRMTVLEANAIGTLYLRADFVKDPSALKALIEEYRNERLEMSSVPSSSLAFKNHVQRSADLHQKLWAIGAAEASAAQTPITSLLVQALNGVIDAHTSRVAALTNRVNDVILILMTLVAIGSVFWLGYGLGLRNSHRLWLIRITTALMISVTANMILDLDRPARGLIEVKQTAIKNAI